MNTATAVDSATVILASASPRRRELLAQLGVSFIVAPADIDEQVLAAEQPQDYVRRMASSKAQVGYERSMSQSDTPGSLVIGADTAVVLGDDIMGKPSDREEGIHMLEQLSGQTHQVMSSVAITNGIQFHDRTSITRVMFRSLRAGEAAAYWDTGESQDKAGAYAIQGLGAVFVREVHGSYTGVVGLPLFETAELLQLSGYRFGLADA